MWHIVYICQGERHHSLQTYKTRAEACRALRAWIGFTAWIERIR